MQSFYPYNFIYCSSIGWESAPSALESGQEARIVQIDFSATFDRVNHQGILYRLCSMGIGGSVLSILTQFVKPITAGYGGWLLE